MADKKDSPEKHVTDSASDKGKEEELVGANEAEEAKDTVAEGGESDGKSATRKRKAEVEHPDIARTPPKRRNANMEIAKQYTGQSPMSSSYSLRSRRIPCFEKVNLNLGELTKTVGKKVKVLKTGTKKLIAGLVESYNKRKKLHKVKLDNGDFMELDMTKDQFELEVEPEKYKLKDKATEETRKRGRPSKKDKGKYIATDQGTKSKKEDFGPKEKVIKLGEDTSRPRPLMMRASNHPDVVRSSDESDSSDSSNDGAKYVGEGSKKT